MKNFIYQIKDTDKGRIDLLVSRLIDFSRARVRGLIEHGGVILNGEICKDPGYRVSVHQTLTVHYEPQCRYRNKSPERPTHGFSVVYVDDYLVVVNKNAGILTVPTEHGNSNTLINLVSTHLNRGQTHSKMAGLVHRLDRETSGLLIFGRTPEITKGLIQQFANRKPEREYTAIVAGLLAHDHGVIRSHLATDKTLNQKSVASEHGQLAVTHFRVVDRRKNATLVVVNLETGRRNQIRVHFSEMQHPVLGDTRYLPHKASHPDWPYKRLALHARLLGFSHPIDGRSMRFEAPLPKEFAQFFKPWGQPVPIEDSYDRRRTSAQNRRRFHPG